MKRWKLLILAAALLPLAARAAEPEANIVIEARVIKLMDQSFKNLKFDEALQEQGTQFLHLDPKARAEWLAKLEAKKDVQILAAPPVAVGSQQSVGVDLRQNQSFTTAVTVELDPSGSVRCVPKELVMPLGCNFQFTPTLSADRQFVRMKYEISETLVHPNTSVHPVTTYITPKHEGGSEGPPIPTTQFIVKPAFDTETMQQTIAIPNGHSMLMEFKSRKCSVSREFKLPIFGDWPLVGELLTVSPTLEDTEHTLVLLTAKTVPVAAKPMPSGPVPSPLGSLNFDIYGVPSIVPTPLHATAAPPLYHAGCVAMQPLPYPTPALAVPTPAAGTDEWPNKYNHVAKLESLEPFTAQGSKNVEILKILLEQYEVACKAGDSAKARTIAAYCLEMDPACFAKH